MDNKIKQYQNRLFNKLFATLPIARKLNNTRNELNLDEPITHFYSYYNKKFWYTKSESKDKFIYIFGLKDKLFKDISLDDATLMVDFDKNEQFNNNSLGMFSVENSEIHILINHDLLQYRYPYFNTGDFKIKSFKSLDNKLNMKIIDLGELNEDFIENLEKLINLSSVLKILDDNREEIKDTEVADKSTQNNPNQCPICLNDKDHFILDSNLNNLKNLKPELCGRCIEKIVAYEFYTKLIPLLKGNDKKDLDIAKEKYGNDQIFDIGLKLLEKYDILKFIGVKRLFFTVDGKSELISEYRKYSDENNLLIDNILQVKNTAEKKNKNKIDNTTTTLTKGTTRKMNLFINALTAGKTHEQACKIANVDSKKVENWYNLGKRGNANYIPFYNKYKNYKPENVEKQKKIEIFLDALKKDSNLDDALKKSDLKLEKVRAWYSLGEKGDENYKEFYLSCKQLLPNGIPKKNKKMVSNEELMNEFIALIEDGATNAEAIEKLKIPKFKVKNFINQGKLGNEKYVGFYNAYMREIEKEKQLKKAKKQEKLSKKQKKASKQISLELNEETTSQNDKKICKICGRTLSTKTNKDICKRCLRKQYASKILLKLLNSIEPEKPFRKEDLKVLNLENIQIKDYIWTLKEFNLITEENNRLQLKSRDELEEFIKESGLDVDEIPQGKNTVKLNKTCKTCGETLEISKFFSSETSEDGFEENCKDCKRKIITAGYLNEIVEFIDYESEFTQDDLKPYYKNPTQLQAKIWALLDNDLVKKNFERNSFILTDEKTAKEFLDKYYEEKTEKQTETEHVDFNKDPKKYTKKDQMKIVLKAISEGKSRKEAAELANIPLYKITHWYNEGRQGYGKDNVNFYRQLKRLENTNKSGNNLRIKEKEYEDKAINRKIFLENFKNGKTKEESAQNADIELSLVHEWYLKGKNDEEPYVEFYESYIEIKNNDIEIQIPQLEKTDEFGTNTSVNQMNIILEDLANGKSEKEAINDANISENTYKYWLNRGKQEFGELYTQFYYYVNKIKERNNSAETPSNEAEDRLNELLKPLDEEYEILFKSSKTNRTGIAWVNIIGKQWVYQKSHENNSIKFSNSNIYKLYQEVKNNNLPWGVRDINKAKPLILKHYELDQDNPSEPETTGKTAQMIYDAGIYAPLPEKYEQSFKSSPMNKSGIAWVNNTAGSGTKWIYERQVNGQIIRFDNEDIYGLYNKVKNENQIWGIRDYEKAKKIIDIPDEFEIPQKQKTTDESETMPQSNNHNIYSPLPEELLDTFNPSQPNKTGIAWVNKIGNKFVYKRMINGKEIKITDNTIEGLHKKVIAQNQIWGVRNYTYAHEFIDIPEDFEIPEGYHENKWEFNTDIYAPLSKEDASKFNQNMNNKTGIAWVNKYGLNWVYQRQIKGKTIRFTDTDIYKLHEIVIKNRQIWGIIDYEKAMKILDPNKNKTEMHEEIETNQNIFQTKVTVNYIEKSANKYDIIINGIIKNNELLDILNRLKLFEEKFKRIVTTSINDKVDIFIELDINKYLLKTFEEKIEDLDWEINK